MIKKLKKLLENSLYEQAYEILKHKTVDEKWRIISNDLYSMNPHYIYTFMIYLISKDENEAEWEYYCFTYLVYCNPFFDDTLRLAAWHLKKAIALDPSNIDYMKQAISVLYSFSEQYFTKNEYLMMAKRVISVEPDNPNACTILHYNANDN